MRRLLAALALLATIPGCDVSGDGDAGSRETESRPKALDGTYVGTLDGAFVAVSAAPGAKGEGRRQVAVFACDGDEVCEWLTGSAAGNRFTAVSGDGDARARGGLTRGAATGTIELAGGETIEYSARRATAAAGLYTVTVSAGGRLEGASAGGVGLTGRSTLPRPGRGTLKLADGTRLRFEAVRSPEARAVGIASDEARVIVLPSGQLTGAGADYYLRSLR
jgi:hypothetical protein